MASPSPRTRTSEAQSREEEAQGCVERTLLSAAFDSSANYRRITVLNLKLSIIGAALLIFTLSMDEIADNVGLTFLPGL